MERFAVCALLMVLVFCIQGLNQANAEKCQRTNAKPYRYCVDDKCTTDKDCGKNEKCLCDGDCGLSCIKKGLKCDNFRKPRNAILRFTGPTGFQQTVTYSCKDGYTLRGSKKRTCRGIGKWDGKNTRCPKLCKDPGDIQFGNRRSDRGDRKYYKVGSTMNYWCFLHYRQQGSSKITCTKSGSWSASPPKCLLPSCQKPVIPQNARSLRKLKSRYRYNEIVSFVCEHGYFTAGGRIQRCMQEGKWSGGGRIRCIPKSCGGAGTPKNGRRRGYVFTFKKKVYYECDRGYLRIGPAFRQCQSNQKWSGDTPTCEPIDCRSLPTPQHGEKIEETKTTYHGRVTFQCKKKGHELKGSATRVCQEDGNWDGSLTTCEPVQCKDPGKPDNGGRRPDVNKYVYEDKVVFECKTNFTQKGDSFIICQHDKSWTGSVPTCLASCSDPGIPKGGYRHHHSFLHGKRVRFSCKNEWKMVGEPTIKCTDGKWDYDAPKCLEGCATPKLPDKGGIYSKKNFYDHGERLSFYCYDGYKLVGDQSTSCRNGKWNNDPPSCKRKCRNPGSPYNGWKNGDDYIEGKQVTFTCSRDYDLIGLQAIQCLNTGEWSGSVPQCKKRCTVDRLQNGVFTSSKNVLRLDTVKHGTRITYTCTSGYTLEGDKRMTCSDGKWSSRTPQCKAPCSNPGSIQNGGKIGKTFSHRDTVRYYCTSGYTLDGPGSLRCNNGRWDTPVPTCKESCRDPGVPRNAIRRGDSFENGKQVSFNCQKGTKLVGSPRLTCDHGQWSSEVPKCLEICNDPGSPRNGYRTAKRLPLLSGDKVTFSCKRKYDLVGSKEIFCDKGTWNGSVPQCLGLCKAPNNIGSVIAHLAELRGGGGGRGGAWYKHGRRIRFSCGFGKELDGANETICADSHWSKDFPECKVPCREPNTIINGTQHGTKFKFQFECDAGYTLKGRSTISCNQGVWSDSPPRCFRNCPDPGRIHNGYMTNKNVEHGQWTSFGCVNGYRIKGKKQLQCDNGQWSDAIPTCIGLCPRVYAPRNGVLLDNNFESGETVRFRCKHGYTLRGPHNITCQDRTWNHGKPPVCKADCTDPGTPKDGQRQGDVFSHGSVVNFTCNGGKTVIGSARIHCTEGSWSYRKPVCEAKCKDPESPPNAMSQLGLTKEGRQTITYSCRSSMALLGERVLTCNQGAWSHDLPSCTDCGSPLGMQNRKIPNANIRASTYQDRYRPWYGRLNNPRAWCSKRQWKPYLEIDLAKPYRITHLATQGSERDNNWVQIYIVTHTLARTSFTAYRENDKEKLFKGNTDTTSIVRQKLNEPFIARKVRFRPHHPTGYFITPACMRVEIYGCDIPTDCVMVGSRVLGQWGTSYSGLDYYYKAYVRAVSGNYVELDLENGEHNDQVLKFLLKTSIVLDVPPKPEELRKETKVLVLWDERFYPGKITGKSGKHYYVKSKIGKAWFTIDQLRLLKQERFCE